MGFNGIIYAIITGIVAAVCLTGGLLILFQVLKRRITRVITEFVSAPDDKTPSPLAAIIDNTGAVIAKHFVDQAKTSLLGMSSVDAKMEKRVGAAMMTDLVSAQNPLLGLLAKFPSVQKLINRRPEYLAIASQLLGGLNIGTNGKKETAAAGIQHKLTLD